MARRTTARRHGETSRTRPPGKPARRTRRQREATTPAPGRRGRHPHHDAPDTEADFRRLAGLPDGPEREELAQRLVCAWMPMAERLALRFRNRGETVEDLQQIAALGLVKAVNGYDPEHGTAFESYAIPTVTGEIKRHFRDNLWGVHVPRRVQELRNRVRTARQELTRSVDDHGPSHQEIAEHTGMTEEEVRLGSQALESFSTLSLDAELAGAEDGYSLQDTLGETEAGFDLVIDRQTVKPELEALPERDRQILYMRFFCDMTQSRIAEQFGMSQMHVSRLISRACRRLATRVGAPAQQ
ncbi:SigB/SigF/SigG family RNA polymerase sigma factor [Streptomyces ochraceiscleroticus]|uniref:SigB/SigF/SigG family RNA polymerase sigma factor n=1 Tax=Streptomyces ochraceiscleroticus TaxID=47761 RepID=A0ABW1MLU8_9ACTN|nr:SigB/SigF/SigG family RNA polymerase sigma factor [Streptomyces ochraceiscleroticus]